MGSISKTELDRLYVHSARCAVRAGLDIEGWRLEHGNASSGDDYYLTGPQMRERLGATRIEAHRTLTAMARAWEMVGTALVVDHEAAVEAIVLDERHRPRLSIVPPRGGA